MDDGLQGLAAENACLICLTHLQAFVQAIVAFCKSSELLDINDPSQQESQQQSQPGGSQGGRRRSSAPISGAACSKAAACLLEPKARLHWLGAKLLQTNAVVAVAALCQQAGVADLHLCPGCGFRRLLPRMRTSGSRRRGRARPASQPRVRGGGSLLEAPRFSASFCPHTPLSMSSRQAEPSQSTHRR